MLIGVHWFVVGRRNYL